MFCPPGAAAQRLRSRKLNRKQAKMQMRAMEEARAAGWNQYHGDLDSSDDDDDSVDGRNNLWAAAPEAAVVPQVNSGRTASTTNESSSSPPPHEEEEGSVDFIIKGFSSKEIFSSEYLNTSSETPLSRPVTKESSPTEQDDDESDEDDDDSVAEDGTALENQKELSDLLSRLQFQKPNSTPSKVVSRFTPATGRRSGYEQQATEGTESTADITETTTGSDFAASTIERKGINNYDSDSSSDEDVNDDDSLDLGGVSTSMWPSQEQHTSNTFSSPGAKSAIAGVQISNITREFFSPHAPKGKVLGKGKFVPPQYATDDEESLDDTGGAAYEEVNHEGAKVFLATQGARYSGTKEDVYEIHNEQGFQTVKTDLEGSSTNVNKLFHESSVTWNAVDGSDDNSDSEDKDDQLHFQPRYEDADNEDDDMWVDLNIEKAETDGDMESKFNDSSSDLHGSKTTPQKSEKDGSCFGGVQLVSPGLFDGSETRSSTKSETSKGNLFSPLSSMVHSIDLDLFNDKTKSDASVSSGGGSDSLVGAASVASCPTYRSPGSVLRSDQYTISGRSSQDSGRSSLSSAFKSSSKSNRVAYSLSSGKKGMSKSEKLYTKSFLPSKPILSKTSSASSVTSQRRGSKNNHTLFVLLVEKAQKIFEVVQVDINGDTTVGDVLARARSAATDPALSEQKYISLCKVRQEIAAPMLPVNLLIDWNKNKTPPLVVAVPEGSSAIEMQMIKYVLWKNPKLRRWWKQEDPFQPGIKGERSTTKDAPVPEITYNAGDKEVAGEK